jgi:CelD/BcsL family acetyltransferase involved in cellulose biosynthesis
MRIAFSEDGRDFSRRDWSDLVEADPSSTFFHSPKYLKLYWEEFGATPDHLLLAFAEADDGTQVGAVAFERIDDTLRFLGGTEVTDYMGPVALPEVGEATAKELVAALVRRDDWVEADLRGLPEDSPWLGWLRDAAEGAGLSVEVADDQNPVAPCLELPGSAEAYLAGLPSKLRHEIRRKARRLASEAAGYEVESSRPETIREDLDHFVAMHRASEGPKGVFMQPGMEIFFRRLAEAFILDGVFHLAFVRVGEERPAGTIGFRLDGVYYLYNSAFDDGWSRLSPGMVLVGDLIRQAADAGFRLFDLLKGDYAYKYRFGARPRRVHRLAISR